MQRSGIVLVLPRLSVVPILVMIVFATGCGSRQQAQGDQSTKEHVAGENVVDPPLKDDQAGDSRAGDSRRLPSTAARVLSDSLQPIAVGSSGSPSATANRHAGHAEPGEGRGNRLASDDVGRKQATTAKGENAAQERLAKKRIELPSFLAPRVKAYRFSWLAFRPHAGRFLEQDGTVRPFLGDEESTWRMRYRIDDTRSVRAR